MPKKLTETQTKEIFRKKISSLPSRPRTEEALLANVFNLLEFFFKRGKGRARTNSKTYTGPALEEFCEYCVQTTLSFVGLSETEINKDYINDDDKKFDKVRLDLNVVADSKIILMQESRVWIDKPFATLKYQVIEDIVYLPHSRAKIDKDIIFPIVAVCCDITEITRATREYFFDMVLKASGLSQTTSYGENRINIFALSAGKRSDGYFDAGMNKQSVHEYITMLIKHFTHYKHRS